MSGLGNKEIFSNNLRTLMERFGKDRAQICADLNFKYTTFTDWYNGNKYPRIDKIEMLATYFGVLKSDLIEDKGGVFSIDDHPRVQKLKISPEAQKIAKAYDKATPKEKHMVRLTLSEYLDDEEEYQYAAARGNSRVKIPVQDDDDLPESDTIIDGL